MAAPANSPEYEIEWGPSPVTLAKSRARISPDFSPPLIAMVAVLGTAFLIVFYARILSRHIRRFRRRWRRWRRRRRLLQLTAASSDLQSPPPSGDGGFSFDPSYSSSDYFLSSYGLDDLAIKALPLSLYSKSKAKHSPSTNPDCAVCLLEFEDDESLRTLPLCSHAFHVDCIDVWLRSHATCPLCRAGVLRHDLPFVPMRAARIRPSLDDLLFDPPADPAAPMLEPDSEIAPAASPLQMDQYSRRDFLLKRSYSFGFERNLAVDRMVLEVSSASPWPYRHRSFWSKRWPSPFGGVGVGVGGLSSASRSGRVFSFRSYRGVTVKSPFTRRRGFSLLSSEPSVRFGVDELSSRRSRSMASPLAIFMRPATSMMGFSSSRMRCGDPEALLSPERLDRG